MDVCPGDLEGAYYRIERKLRGYMLTVVIQAMNAGEQNFKDPQKDASCRDGAEKISLRTQPHRASVYAR